MDAQLSKRYAERMHHDPTHDEFVSKWLSNIKREKYPCKPVIGIVNGWMSAQQKNQWYADALSKGLHTFSYDSRGQGESPKKGEMNSIQGAIDANKIISKGFEEYDKICIKKGGEKAIKILQGNCVGTMTLAAMFAGGLPLSSEISGTILISPVSTFNLPLPLKMTFFLPVWFAQFAIEKVAPIFTKLAVPGNESESSRNEALERLQGINYELAIKQARQIFWKENVSEYWKHINVPSLILVGNSDPIVKIKHSYDPYNQLKYPIWIELDAPDHLLLEGNIDYLKNIIPKFANDPWGVYDEFKHISPYT
ncbi:MAG: alpha/beta fold hydrolase [Candidatus Kariarchaeaceae archaeon]|jgi:pimeloyl-ACP methyl ester carboxylesterase